MLVDRYLHLESVRRMPDGSFSLGATITRSVLLPERDGAALGGPSSQRDSYQLQRQRSRS